MPGTLTLELAPGRAGVQRNQSVSPRLLERVIATTIYTNVLNLGRSGVTSPADSVLAS